MSNVFVPNKPEIKIKVEISAREGHMLKVLRKFSFGTFTVHKANNLIIRVESNESQMINELEGLDLSKEKVL